MFSCAQIYESTYQSIPNLMLSQIAWYKFYKKTETTTSILHWFLQRLSKHVMMLLMSAFLWGFEYLICILKKSFFFVILEMSAQSVHSLLSQFEIFLTKFCSYLLILLLHLLFISVILSTAGMGLWKAGPVWLPWSPSMVRRLNGWERGCWSWFPAV